MPSSRRRSRRKRRPLRVGTDCSGIEAPIQALKNLGVPFRHVFSSDIDKYCIQSILANYEPELLFGDPNGKFPDGDIRKRKMSDVPDLDLYVCGFPCQPFSQAGMKKGLEDPRGNVFEACLKVIRKKLPKYFILENVRGLLSNDGGRTWDTIWKKLQMLKRYGVSWKLLNTKDYGIPQSRRRVFIVGVRDGEPFEFPGPTHQKKPLSSYVDSGDRRQQKPSPSRKENVKEAAHLGLPFVDLAQLRAGVQTTNIDCAPCICRKCDEYWCVPHSRRASTGELLALQGFPKDFLRVVSNTHLKRQLGNSMSVNVLEAILGKLLRTKKDLDALRPSLLSVV